MSVKRGDGEGGVRAAQAMRSVPHALSQASGTLQGQL